MALIPGKAVKYSTLYTKLWHLLTNPVIVSDSMYASQSQIAPSHLKYSSIRRKAVSILEPDLNLWIRSGFGVSAKK